MKFLQELLAIQESKKNMRPIGIHKWYIVGGDSSFEIFGEWDSEKEAQAVIDKYEKEHPKETGDFEVKDGADASEMSKNSGEDGYYYTDISIDGQG